MSRLSDFLFGEPKHDCRRDGHVVAWLNRNVSARDIHPDVLRDEPELAARALSQPHYTAGCVYCRRSIRRLPGDLFHLAYHPEISVGGTGPEWRPGIDRLEEEEAAAHG